mgnify:CR=1 FL=1
MTQAASQAWAFYRDVAKNQKVWTVRDAGGFPAPKTVEGIRSHPFWSSLSRVQKIIKTVPAYAGFDPYEISWSDFCQAWVPGMTKDGLLMGVNWSGKRALGYDLEPKQVQQSVEAVMKENRQVPSHASRGTSLRSDPEGCWWGLRNRKMAQEPILGARQTIKVGEPVVIESDSPDKGRGVVFEDEGETGYFYARDYSVQDRLFVDALHIYTVEVVTDKDIPSDIHILWTPDYTKAVLIINSYPHAVFDFTKKCGYSRHQFPDPFPETGWARKPWDDSLRGLFY